MLCRPDPAIVPVALWFETRGVAALLTHEGQDLILRRREAPSRRMKPPSWGAGQTAHRTLRE
jgi:hypothetical protein